MTTEIVARVAQLLADAGGAVGADRRVAKSVIVEVLVAMRGWSKRTGACWANPDPSFFEEGLLGFACAHGLEEQYDTPDPLEDGDNG